MHASRRFCTLEEILSEAKSKRYTRTRLDRMVMCAFLGLDQDAMTAAPEYTRVLAFNDRGRQLLAAHRESGRFLHTGQRIDHPNWLVEQRCESLYGLFRQNTPGDPDQAARNRIFYKKS